MAMLFASWASRIARREPRPSVERAPSRLISSVVQGLLELIACLEFELGGLYHSEGPRGC
jgi:hypothetical protein